MNPAVDARFAHCERRPTGDKKRAVGEAVPWGRMDRPEDRAGIAALLAPADSDDLAARTPGVDGGNWMS